MKLLIESVRAYIPVSGELFKDAPEGLKHTLIDQLAHQAYMGAVEGGKPRRKVGCYKSRFRVGRFVDFTSMRVTTQQPSDFFIRDIYALTMDATARFTRNRRVRWGRRRNHPSHTPSTR